MSCDNSDISTHVAAANRQSVIIPLVFGAIAAAACAAGIILGCGPAVAFLGCGVLTWLVVQLGAVAYLRTAPDHPGVGIPVLAGILTVAGAALTALVSNPGYEGAIAFAGGWLACGAVAEILRGARWRRDISSDTVAGDAARLLAVNGGFDGTPIAHFIVIGLLAGAWVFLIDQVWLVIPFALVAHIGVGLFFAARASVTVRHTDMVG